MPFWQASLKPTVALVIVFNSSNHWDIYKRKQIINLNEWMNQNREGIEKESIWKWINPNSLKRGKYTVVLIGSKEDIIVICDYFVLRYKILHDARVSIKYKLYIGHS